MYVLHALAAAVQSTADDGLSFGDILDSVPTDPASIFTLLLLVGCFGAVVWFGSRSNGKGGDA